MTIARVLLAAFLIVGLAGCVERKLKIRTDPPGALVSINDEEVGVTPVEVSFLWYGDYELVFRKTGYQTLRTHCCLESPWWQYPPFDLITETMIARTIRDEHELPTFSLRPAEEPPVADVVQRAVDLRHQAVRPEP